MFYDIWFIQIYPTELFDIVIRINRISKCNCVFISWFIFFNCLYYLFIINHFFTYISKIIDCTRFFFLKERRKNNRTLNQLLEAFYTTLHLPLVSHFFGFSFFLFLLLVFTLILLAVVTSTWVADSSADSTALYWS